MNQKLQEMRREVWYTDNYTVKFKNESAAMNSFLVMW